MGRAEFESATPTSSAWCSPELSYRPFESGPDAIRTRDTWIKSPVLCHFSHSAPERGKETELRAHK